MNRLVKYGSFDTVGSSRGEPGVLPHGATTGRRTSRLRPENVSPGESSSCVLAVVLGQAVFGQAVLGQAVFGQAAALRPAVFREAMFRLAVRRAAVARALPSKFLAG